MGNAPPPGSGLNNHRESFESLHRSANAMSVMGGLQPVTLEQFWNEVWNDVAEQQAQTPSRRRPRPPSESEAEDSDEEDNFDDLAEDDGTEDTIKLSADRDIYYPGHPKGAFTNLPWATLRHTNMLENQQLRDAKWNLRCQYGAEEQNCSNPAAYVMSVQQTNRAADMISYAPVCAQHRDARVAKMVTDERGCVVVSEIVALKVALNHPTGVQRPRTYGRSPDAVGTTNMRNGSMGVVY